MHIESITLCNFKSFYGTTTIDFTNLKGLYKVTGKIGSGKTTLGEAIIYGLYGRVANKNNPTLISWGEKKACIDISLESRGRHIDIHREISTYGQSPLVVRVDGTELIANNKLSIQSQLETEYLDVPRTTMELLCIISFNNFKSLSTLNTKDTRQFLNDVLGMDILENYVSSIKETQAELRDESLRASTILESTRASLAKLRNMPDQVKTAEMDHLAEAINKIKKDVEESRATYNGRLEPLATELKELDESIRSTTASGKEQKRQYKLIASGTCPTCGSPIDPTKISTTRSSLEDLGKQYKDLCDRKARLLRVYGDIESEMTNYIGTKLSDLKSQENSLNELRIRARTRAEMATQRIDELETDLVGAEAESRRLADETQDYDQLLYIFQNDIRTAVLAEYVPLINEKIQEMCELMSLEFIPEYDLEFKCSIHRGGEVIATSSLSTGQQKLVDMIIILSILGSVLSRVESNVIFLDELFSNLDARTREDLLYVFRSTLPEDSTVLIISHQDIDDDLFNGNIRMSLVDLPSGRTGTVCSLPE